ncbi:MAG: prolipoprotein diacylglyceryl transferase family protein [Myxococcota bacterium]
MNFEQTAHTIMTTIELSQWTIFATSGVVAIVLGLGALWRERLDGRRGVMLMGAALFAGLYVGHWTALAFKPHRVFADPMSLLLLTRGGVCSLGVYGGAALGMAALARFNRWPFWRYADAFAPGLLVAAAIARTSCLLHGCDFGRVASSTLPWAIRYPRGTSAFRYLNTQGWVDAYRDVGVPMHPFPLYEAVPVLLVGLGVLWAPNILGERPGQRAAGCAALYCGIRAMAEHFRAVDTVMFGEVTVLQGLCMGGCALFTGYWIACARGDAYAMETHHHAVTTHR